MASMGSCLRHLAMIGALTGMVMTPAVVTAGVDKPVLERGKGERCVEQTQFMRRNHMELLKHHRDETLRLGIRTTKHSLKGCVDCHASSTTGSVASSKEDFCMACHAYAGVKLDCWDCHASKPMSRYRSDAVRRDSSSMALQQGGQQP